jgi:hypothetical protein
VLWILEYLKHVAAGAFQERKVANPAKTASAFLSRLVQHSLRLILHDAKVFR